MDVQVSFVDDTPVVTLAGRFDGFGAQQFDAAMQRIDSASAVWVLDCTAVAYISSTGLRSLFTLEKVLRARDGGLILAGVGRSMRQVLEVTRLDNWLRSAPTLNDALERARNETGAPALERTVAGRTIRVRRTAPGTSSVEWWTGTPERPFVGAALADLGFAFGTGGLGEGAADGRAGLGSFVSTPLFAGVLPFDAHGTSDFMTGSASAVIPVHIVSALSVSGAPAFVAEVTSAAPFRLLDLVDDLYDIAGAELDAAPRALAFVAVAARAHGGGLLGVGVATDPASRSSGGDGDTVLRDWAGAVPIASGRSVVGGAVTLHGADLTRAGADLGDAIGALSNPDLLHGVVGIDDATPLDRATIWLFLPSTVRGGGEKLLRLTVEGDGSWQPEWDAIVRRLYADCQSVTLTPLHGGYNSKTFRVVAYDREARRTLPTVLKIGPPALTAREEQANRDYVARFILNNGTTVLGGAAEGDWAGLRYNFLGVNGPESRLVWLREHYLQRSTADVVALFETLLTRVLKPWYGQPKWEQVWLYREHTPLRLFPQLFETAERELGVSADEPTLTCQELGVELPNPMHFLRHEYARRSGDSRLWYTAICHGDLNLQNVLVDERENVYVIDFSETRPRNAVSDFARIEPITKFEFLRLDSDDDLRQVLEFEVGLTSVARLSDPPPLVYRGNDPLVARAHAVIALLRRAANTVTLFEQDVIPYWLAVLEWTYSVICYRQVSPRQKRYAVYSAALICRAIQDLEKRAFPHSGSI